MIIPYIIQMHFAEYHQEIKSHSFSVMNWNVHTFPNDKSALYWKDKIQTYKDVWPCLDYQSSTSPAPTHYRFMYLNQGVGKAQQVRRILIQTEGTALTQENNG